jgi:hypothetical protein
VIPVPEWHTHVSNAKLFFQLRATLIIALILSPQFAFQKPCLTLTDRWWEKVYSIDTKSIGTELKKWRTPLKRWRKPEQW